MPRKTDNDDLLRPTAEPPKAIQREMFRYVYPEQPPEPEDSILAKLRAKLRAERDERLEIARELFGEVEHERSLTVQQVHQVTQMYFDRHPERRPSRTERIGKPRPGWRFEFRLRWFNPYTEPPNGLPRELLLIHSDLDNPTQRQWDKINAIMRRMMGYSLYWDAEKLPEVGKDGKVVSRKWSDERKFANRLRLLRRRMEKKYSIPELLEEAIATQIASKPEYYGVKPLAIPVELKVPETDAIETTAEIPHLQSSHEPCLSQKNDQSVLIEEIVKRKLKR